MSYLFGDNRLAARRLRVLARVFEPPTRDFLAAWQEAGGLDPHLVAPTVLDLGCGPGHTTRLLATLLERHVTGVDSSDAFLYEARRLGPTRVDFVAHDVTDPAFPTPGAHLMYARFLVSHLPDVAAALATWRANLRAGGWLLLEEPEWIATEVEAFRSYLGRIERALRERGSELYVGPRLSREAHAAAGFAVVIDRVHEHEVSDRDAATMFALNLPTVRAAAPEGGGPPAAGPGTGGVPATAAGDPPVEPEVAEVDRLQQELDDLAHLGLPLSRIRWGVRQIALRLE